MTRTSAVAAAMTTLALTLTGCSGSGSDSGSDEDDTASRAISDSIMREQEGGAAMDVFAMKRAEADCIGRGFVDEIGVERLQQYGFLTEELEAKAMTNVAMEPADAEAATGVLFDCADVPALMEEALSSGQQELDPTTRECIDEVLTEEKLRSMFTLMFSGKSDQATEEVLVPLTECAAPQQ